MAEESVEALTKVVVQMGKDLSQEKMGRLQHVGEVEKKLSSTDGDLKDLERKVESLQKKVAELEKAKKK